LIKGMNNLIQWRCFSPAVSAAVAGGAVMVLFSGCLGSGATVPPRTAAKPGTARFASSPTPSGAAAAKIVSMNSDLGFVVVDFGSRTVPAVGTRVNVYRGDKRVGAVRITEPVHTPLATADIAEGEVRVGDEAR
jgi:hypothetical protein